LVNSRVLVKKTQLNINMKLKLTASTLAVSLAIVSLGLAQDNTATNAAAVQPPAAVEAPAVPPAPAAEQPPAVTPPPAGAPTPADTTAVTTNQDSVLSVISIDDIPLTDAIKNLARQAGLNYILDPHIPYGQVGADGRIVAQPNISIHWEHVTADQALSALLGSYSLVLVEDPKTKISKITVKDPAAPDPLITKIIQLKFSSPSNTAAAVSTVFTDKRSKVLPEVRTSQLIVTCTEKEMNTVVEMITSIDTQTKQVLIEAKVLETTLNPKTSKGIDWTGTFANQHVSFGNNLKTHSSIDSVNNTLATDVPKVLLDTAKGFNPATAFLDADGLSIALSFLNNSSDTKLISEPRMVTLDNMKANIDVGLLFPIVNTTAGTANTTGGSSISYSNLTVNLDVTPRIAASDFIELKVQQGILRLGPQFHSTVGGQQNNVDSFFTRRVDTTVLIPSGNTLVMGGLISDENTRANTKVPVLGDIPALGLLFRKDSKERNRNNLIIFITPTIVRDSDFQPTHTDYLKSSQTQEANEEWSSWDSGKKKSWGRKKTDGSK